MYDKFYWWLNRKPSNKYVIYMFNIIFYLLLGMLSTLGILCLIGALEYKQPKLLIPGIAIIFTVFGELYFGYIIDKRHGYIDAEHDNYLRYRERIGRKLGKI